MRAQSGLALLTMIGVMLALSLLTTAGFQQGLFALRLAANSADQAIARMAADYALREAENTPESLAIGVLEPSPQPTVTEWQPMLEANGVASVLPAFLADRATARVLVEAVEQSELTSAYRITVLAQTHSGQAQQIVQINYSDTDNSRSWRQLR
ncbi:hypothetical protein GH984_08785 [Spiribacter sp. C176]|uniref:Type 4 fimbrial biogenesis protein PilX N-terminal domain-containing protein n=1 Tax=Spiribacter salilacus TaxID=2664894 RepID=A0A6N7QQV4_9GAMM|nr:hypothetical protein [Spiribacter salilacus]MRH78801.1 hypothetical protein [Spiribacter salilacus]